MFYDAMCSKLILGYFKEEEPRDEFAACLIIQARLPRMILHSVFLVSYSPYGVPFVLT